MDKLHIIKIGGNVIDDEGQLASFLDLYSAVPGKKILVHGGGKLATKLAEQLDVPQQLVDGRRITDAATLKIVTMVYAGYINKNIVARLQSFGVNSIGLSGADGNVIKANKRVSADHGFVGDIDTVNVYFLHSLLKQDVSPVICPITHNEKGQLLNTNADTIAQEVSTAMSRLYDVTLIYLFEKEGVMTDVSNENSVIKMITKKEFLRLKEEGRITAGMIPKMENAFDAIDKGVKKVLIGKAAKLNQLLQGNAGTTIQ